MLVQQTMELRLLLGLFFCEMSIFAFFDVIYKCHDIQASS